MADVRQGGEVANTNLRRRNAHDRRGRRRIVANPVQRFAPKVMPRLAAARRGDRIRMQEPFQKVADR
jgi:hypothetical protein